MANYKIVVFVPNKNLDEVRNAMAKAGAGVIGNYTQCSFASPGTGTFFGGEGADPTIGAAGQLERVPEWRLEMVVPAENAEAVVAAMKATHPYEEPAYDVYQLVDI